MVCTSEERSTISILSLFSQQLNKRLFSYFTEMEEKDQKYRSFIVKEKEWKATHYWDCHQMNHTFTISLPFCISLSWPQNDCN